MEYWNFGFQKAREALRKKEHPSWLKEKMEQKLAAEY
jgi:hypothetical protein